MKKLLFLLALALIGQMPSTVYLVLRGNAVVLATTAPLNAPVQRPDGNWRVTGVDGVTYLDGVSWKDGAGQPLAPTVVSAALPPGVMLDMLNSMLYACAYNNSVVACTRSGPPMPAVDDDASPR